MPGALKVRNGTGNSRAVIGSQRINQLITLVNYQSALNKSPKEQKFQYENFFI
jgi:hypothetical protein